MTADGSPPGRHGSPEVDERVNGERDTAVRLENVTKAYGDVVAVDDVSMSIRDREFVSILGPSGAGKTTLLHMIAGFVTPTRGEIYIWDTDVTRRPPYERNIGMVFQNMALFPHMTVEENISFPLEMRRFEPERIDDRVREMLELIRLPDIAERDVSELSGGQQQRVAMARALAFEPSLLLLDEPLSSLDKKLREEMRKELLRIHREANVTTVHVTHNQEEALTMADRIAVISRGSIAQYARTQELYSRPNSAFVAEFVGDTNLLRGTVVERNDEGYRISIGGNDLSVDCRAALTEGSLSRGDGATVGVRFEQIRIGDDVSTDNVFAAVVNDVIFRGDLINYVVTIRGTGDRSGDWSGNRSGNRSDDQSDHRTGEQLEITVLNSTGTHIFDRGDDVQVGWNETDSLVYSD